MPPAARRTTATGTATVQPSLVGLSSGLFVVRRTEDMQALVEGAATFFLSLGGTFGMLGSQLTEKLEYQLQKEGLDQHGRLSAILGTSAQRAAKAITDPLFRCADAQTECAAYVQLAGRMWAQNFSEPVNRARAMRDNEDLLEA